MLSTNVFLAGKPESHGTTSVSLVCLTLKGRLQELPHGTTIEDVSSRLTERLSTFLCLNDNASLVKVYTCLPYEEDMVRFIVSLPSECVSELAHLWKEEKKCIHRAFFNILSKSTEPVLAMSYRLGSEDWPYAWDRTYFWPGTSLKKDLF